MSFLNVGNTCYLASALQCLFTSSHFVSNMTQYLKQNDPLVKSLVHLYEQWVRDVADIDPSEFYSVFRTHYALFDNQQQHDAHEALQVLMDLLSSRCSRMTQSIYQSPNKAAHRQWFSKPINLMDETFQVQLENTIRCNACNHQVVSYQCEYGLFERSVCKDLLLNEYKCDHCKRLGTCSQTVQVHHAPPSLILKSGVCNHTRLQIGTKRYRLAAVCKYYPSRFKSGGHYTAVVRKETQWFLKDDGMTSLLERVDDLCNDGCFFVFEMVL